MFKPLTRFFNKKKSGTFLIIFITIILGIGIFYFMLDEGEPIFTLAGSNTIGASLAPELCKVYMEEELDADNVKIVRKSKKRSLIIGWIDGERKNIQVLASGSSTGFEQVLEGKADLVMASRQCKESERASFINVRKGDLTSSECEHVLGLDAVSIITHPDNPIDKLSVEQLAAIFSCKIDNWSALGGVNLPIRLFVRDNNSGTFDTFNKLILERSQTALCKNVESFESNEELSKKVSKNKEAIGFTGLAHTDKVKTIAIGDGNIDAISPELFNVALENYPISRRLYLYTQKEETNQFITSFIQFSLSDTGQALVNKMGFVSLAPSTYLSQFKSSVNNKDSIPQPYKDALETARQLPLAIRFNDDAIKMDTRSIVDIRRVGNLLRQQKDTDIILFGFSDSHSDESIQKELAFARVQYVQNALIKQGVEAHRITSHALGSVLPVANNDLEITAKKNRRVEIWLR